MKEFRSLFEELNWPIVSYQESLVASDHTGIEMVVKSQDEHPISAQALADFIVKCGFEVKGPRWSELKSDDFEFEVFPLK